MNSRDDFYITLFSNDSMNFFPDNTLSTFENRIPTHLDLTNGDWKVGLSEIYTNDYLQTDIYDKKTAAVISLGQNEVWVGSGTNKIKVIKRMGYTFYPEEKSQFRFDDWKINLLPTLINNITPSQGFTRAEVLKEFYNELLVTLSDDAAYKVDYKPVTAANQLKLIRISRSFDQESFFLKQNTEYTIPTLIKELFQQKQNIINYRKTIVQLYNRAVETYNDEKSGMVMVYTDIIQPEIFGNNKIRALRAINIDNCRKQNNMEFKNVQYVPVEKKIFETIAFNISDQYGKNINFVSNYNPTKIVLHFKKFSKAI